MEQLKILLQKNELPEVTIYDSNALYILGEFLTTEVLSLGSYLWYDSWLESGTKGVSGNLYRLEEKNDKIIICEQEFMKVEEDPIEDPLIFVTTRSQLRQILRRWGEFMTEDQRPEEIIITQHDNGEVTFEGVYAKEQKSNN